MDQGGNKIYIKDRCPPAGPSDIWNAKCLRLSTSKANRNRNCGPGLSDQRIVNSLIAIARSSLFNLPIFHIKTRDFGFW